MSKIIELDNQTFDTNVNKCQLNVPIILKFWGSWCQPCKKLNPVLENIANNYVGKIKVFSLNVETSQAISSKFQVKSIPTLLFLINGKVIDRKVGFINEEKIKKIIKLKFDVQY